MVYGVREMVKITQAKRVEWNKKSLEQQLEEHQTPVWISAVTH